MSTYLNLFLINIQLGFINVYDEEIDQYSGFTNNNFHLDRTKLIMYGIDPKFSKNASGMDTDALSRKIAHPMSEDRAATKKTKSNLKFGMSKESPFLMNKNYELIHPSTKVIFGEPEKRVRPYTSKVNSMLRKSLFSAKNKRAEDSKVDPAFKNSFSQFAKCSLSPEKQKLIAFYSSASTLKGLRKKIAKCKFLNY